MASKKKAAGQPEDSSKNSDDPSATKTDLDGASTHEVIAKSEQHSHKNQTPFPVVGIGASAGGLEAFDELLDHMPADTGMSFVIVTHHKPGHKNLLPELLGKHAKMPVVEAADGLELEPNHVYISPPSVNLALLNGSLHIMDAKETKSQRAPLPIDYFFRSLAADRQEHAICIVLSGTGTDGSIGLKAIKGESGMAMVQQPQSAKYAGMPSSAIATGLVDYVLPVAELAAQLIAYAKGPYPQAHAPTKVPNLPTEPRQKNFLLPRTSRADIAGMTPEDVQRMIHHQCRTAIIDVTEQREATEWIVQAKRLRSMVENLPAGAVYVDHDRIELNLAAEKLTGYSRSELQTVDAWFSKLYGNREQEIHKLHEAGRAAGFPERVSTTITTKDGQERFVEIVCHGFDDHEVWLLHDITERVETELKLRVQQRAIQSATNGILITDATQANNPIVYANPAFGVITGYRVDEVLGKNCRFLQGELTDQEDRRILRNAIENGRHCHITIRNQRKDGSPFWNELTISPVKDENENVTHFIGIQNDVTESINTQEELRREHELNESLINTAQGIVLLLDMQGKILRFNPYFESLTGWRLEDVRGLDWLETCIPENERPTIRQRFKDAVAGKRTIRKVNGVLCCDGSIRTIEWFDVILYDNNEEQIGLLATGQDITERRAMERHLLQIADDEKRRIGNDLHDGLGQELTGLSMMAESLRLDLQDKAFPESEIAEKIAQQVDDSLQKLRTLARGMNPVDIDPQGLESELTQLANHVSGLYGIECKFTCDGRIDLGSSEIATNLFRIAQEAITNAAKHGKANQVELSIVRANGELVLQISDNGTGIADLEKIQTGVGMRSMRYRADVIGGSMNIKQRKQGGTAVICRLPVS